MKRIFTHFFLYTLPCLLLGVGGCTKESNEVDEIYILTGTASSVASVSQVQSNAIAAISGGYSVRFSKVALNITWSNLSSPPKGATIYCRSEVGATDIMVKNFGVTEGSHAGLAAGELQVTGEQVEDLKNGRWYYTVNSVAYPLGELRGSVAIKRNQ